jgi:lipid-binding SYLF domain-containing protein
MKLNRQGIVALALSVGCATSRADADDSIKEAKDTVQLFKNTDPGLDNFFARATGYAVFRSVGKGGLGVGGAYGSGVLFERGKAVGKTSLMQVTIGFQLGGQAYSEIIFFQTEKALADFKGGQFALAAEASAVALSSGASANAKYQQGVAIFTSSKGGLMYEASVGGQKFSYEPFRATHPSTSSR